MGLFEEMLYPDNKRRFARVQQLVDDIATISYEASASYERVEKLVEEINERFADILGAIGQDPPPLEDFDIQIGETVLTMRITSAVLGIVTMRATYAVLQQAAISIMLKRGMIGAAGFAKLVGVPVWAKIGAGVGAFAAVVALEMLFDAIQGARARDKMRGAINELINPRACRKLLALKNADVLETLSTLNATFEVMKELGEYDMDMIREVIERISTRHAERIEATEMAEAVEDLRKIDQARGAWTNEDPVVTATGVGDAGRPPLMAAVKLQDVPACMVTVSEILVAAGFREDRVQIACAGLGHDAPSHAFA